MVDSFEGRGSTISEKERVQRGGGGREESGRVKEELISLF